MTDEELKEEEGYCEGYNEGLKRGYLDGIAEDRLENFNLASIAKKQRDDARKENEELKVQNKGLIHLLESIQSAISGIKKNKDKEIVLYWIKENAIRVFKEEKQKGFSFDWLK